MNELDKILNGLIQRTLDGKLRWSTTATRNKFATSVDTISVAIGEISSAQGRFAGRPRLEIFNERGDLAEILQVSDDSTSEQDLKLEHLHQLARRSALNIQETLEKLAKALDA